MSDTKAADCVKVAVRVRPFIASETTRGCVQIVEKSHGLEQLYITGDTTSKVQEFYAYNNVFMPDQSQFEVYNNSVKPMIGKLFEGYNVTILAYGQTGSGKTYTMGTCFEGNWNDPKTGIIPRALRDIFKTIREKEDANITATCNFMELYQENLYDLLSGKIKDQSICEIREDNAKGIIITGLTDMAIETENQAARYLMEGGENRSVGATAMNNVSSRSHAIFTVNFKIVNDNGTKTNSKFHLVDLAGSERSKKTQATGKRFKEGVKINQGLLALGNVISALGGGQGTNTNGFISYRDSKLTRLLQDSLGGNSLTLMIACVSPADYNIEETLSTLRYADRAKRIKNKPVKNLDAREQELERLKMLLKTMSRRALFAETKIVEFIGDQEWRKCQESENLENAVISPATPGKNKIVVHECGDACKKQKTEKEAENNELRKQISEILTSFHNMQHARVFEESIYTELIEKFDKLVELLLKTCPAEFATPGTTIFQEIETLTKSVEETIKNFKAQRDEISNEDDFKIDENSQDDPEGNRRLLEYTQAQMESLKQIRTLEQEMKIKQDLLNRKCENQPMINEETDKNIEDLKSKIHDLEKELDEVRSSNNATMRRDQNVTKVNMDRKHKVDKLEKELTEMKKKCACLERAKKIAEEDKKRIEDLKNQIQKLKSDRINMVRQQRLEQGQYLKYKKTAEKEVNVLKEQSRKQQNNLKRIERMHEKQQAVLKRKVEEAKAANKRLQDAMDRNKKAQESRNSSKKSIEKPQDVIQNYIDHEIMVLLSTIDAKIAMQNLMNDRELLHDRLLTLKSTVNKTDKIESEIEQLTEDLEMRNTQIGDIRTKVMETDIETKMKTIPDNFKTVPELRSALGYVLRTLLDNREEHTDSKTKAEDLKISYETAEERIIQMSEDMQKMVTEHELAKSQMEREFESKIAFLNAINNPEDLEIPDNKSTRKEQFKWMTQALVKKSAEIGDLKRKNENLEAELDRLQKSKKPKVKKQDGTFTVDDSQESEVESDESFEDFDDSFNDPEWRKTPAGKRLKTRPTMTLLKESYTKRMDASGLLANISESSENSSVKRSFNGQLRCKCKGSCATRLCKCKKSTTYCNDNCQCSDACMNLPDLSKKSDGASSTSVVTEKENDEEKVASPKRSKTDFNDITTPYYPYKTKKRKPLLQI